MEFEIIGSTSMIKKNTITLSILILTTTIFLALGNMVALNVFNLNFGFENKWILILLYSIFLLFFTYKISFSVPRNKIIFFILWQLFILTVFVSKNMHGTFNLTEYLLYSLLIPVSFFSINIIKYKNIFMIASLLSVIPFLYFLTASNTLAILIWVSGLSLLILLLEKNMKDKYIYLSMMIISILLFVTRSRATLISFLFISLFLVIITTLRKKNNSYLSLALKILTYIALLIIVYFFYDNILDLIFNKKENTSYDLTSGRSYMWEYTIQTGITMFGNGENYFEYMYSISDAHNIFIQILGSYGLISLILFIIITLYIIIKSISLYKESFTFIIFFLAFYILGIAENLFFIDSRMIHVNMMFFFYLGYLLNFGAALNKF